MREAGPSRGLLSGVSAHHSCPINPPLASQSHIFDPGADDRTKSRCIDWMAAVRMGKMGVRLGLRGKAVIVIAVVLIAVSCAQGALDLAREKLRLEQDGIGE